MPRTAKVTKPKTGRAAKAVGTAKAVKKARTAKAVKKAPARRPLIGRAYELTLVVSPTVRSENRKKVIESIKKEITALKGSAEKIDEWGLKDLAYPIAKHYSGWYAHLVVKIPGSAVQSLDRGLRRNGNLLRHLIVKI